MSGVENGKTCYQFVGFSFREYNVCNKLFIMDSFMCNCFGLFVC